MSGGGGAAAQFLFRQIDANMRIFTYSLHVQPPAVNHLYKGLGQDTIVHMLPILGMETIEVKLNMIFGEHVLWQLPK